MRTLLKGVVLLMLLAWIAALVVAPGVIERYFPFAQWWRNLPATGTFRFTAAALLVSVVAIVFAVRLAWMFKAMRAKFDEALDELRVQRLAIESMDANMGRLISICANRRVAPSTREDHIDEESGAGISDSTVNEDIPGPPWWKPSSR